MGELAARLAKLEAATLSLMAAAESQAKFWRSHQRAARDREDKTRFAVKAEPWENKVFAARSALEELRKPLSYDDIPVPTDIAEFGARHKLEEFGNATYRNGYMDCQRAFLKATQHQEKKP